MSHHLPVHDGRRQPGGQALRTSDLSPFVDALYDGMIPDVRRLFGLSDEADVRLEGVTRRDVPWALRVRLGDLPLEIGGAAPGVRAWFVGRSVTLSYGRLPGADDLLGDPARRAVLEALRARVAEADARDDGLIAAIRDAVVRQRAYAGVRDAYYRQVSPRSSLIRLGFRCNQRCSFCWQDRDWPDAPSEMYFRWLDEIATAKRRDVCFSGGEPTIHPDLAALVERAARHHGLEVSLQTNAIRLGRAEYLATLVRAGLRTVFVSYHSADPEVSDRMTAAPGTHRRTVAGIEACLDAGVNVELNCLVESANVRMLGDHARSIVERFVTPFPENPVARVSYSDPERYHDAGAWDRARTSFDEVRAHLLEAVTILTAAGVGVEGLGTCGFPPCMFREMPALLNWFSLAEEDPTDLSGRAYGKVCEGCAVRSRCLGVRRHTIEEGGERSLVPFAEAPPGFGTPRPR
jgi:pyruvate-formate lyase-activating enzyme